MGRTTARRLLGVALIVTTVALFTHAIGHWHANASDELHCQTCQAAHTASPQVSAPVAVRPPVPVARFVPVEERAAELELPLAPSVPRAPPL